MRTTCCCIKYLAQCLVYQRLLADIIFSLVTLRHNLLIILSVGLHLPLSSLSLSLSFCVLIWIQVLALPMPISLSPNIPIEVYLDCNIKSSAHQTSYSKLFLGLFLSVPTVSIIPNHLLCSKDNVNFTCLIMGLCIRGPFAFFSGQLLLTIPPRA